MTRRNFVALAVAALFFVPPLAFYACRTVPPAEPLSAAYAPAGLPIRAVVFGDTREKSDLEVWRESSSDVERNEVIAGIVSESPAFVINSGDLVLEGSSGTCWALFDRENRPLCERGIPYYPALGNHDYRGRDDLALANYFARFPQISGRKWYAIEAVNTWLLVLDSNFDDLKESEVAEQGRWLESRLEAATADGHVKFVILVCHHPPYTNSKTHRPNEAVEREFVARMKTCAKARTMFAGHVHTVERFEIDGRHFINSGGGGAPLNELKTGDTRFKDLYPGGEKRGFNYCVLTIGADRIDVEIKELDEGHAFRSRDKFAIE